MSENLGKAEAPDDFVVLCMFCKGKIRPEGEVPEAALEFASHGICDPCYAEKYGWDDLGGDGVDFVDRRTRP